MAAKKKSATGTAVVPAGQKVDPETGEVTTLPVLAEEFNATTVSVKVKKQVTMPVLSWPEGATIVFKAVDAIRQGKEVKGSRGGAVKMEPADVMTVEAPNGAMRQLIVGAVLKAELQEGYTNDSYVGKWFQATKHAPNAAKGKRYATYSIQEVELE